MPETTEMTSLFLQWLIGGKYLHTADIIVASESNLQRLQHNRRASGSRLFQDERLSASVYTVTDASAIGTDAPRYIC